MNPFEVMAEPIRRRIVELLASGEETAGLIEEVICAEYGVGRSAVQHHLRYLVRVEWTIVRQDWRNHWHRLDPSVIPTLEKAVWRYRKLWDRRVGWIDGEGDHYSRTPQTIGAGKPVSRKGRRGRGHDPDTTWAVY